MLRSSPVREPTAAGGEAKNGFYDLARTYRRDWIWCMEVGGEETAHGATAVQGTGAQYKANGASSGYEELIGATREDRGGRRVGKVSDAESSPERKRRAGMVGDAFGMSSGSSWRSQLDQGAAKLEWR